MTALLLPGETLTLGLNVIVRPGDQEGWTETWYPPQDWVALTGPCPHCHADGDLIRGGKAVYCKHPDHGRDGRRIVPLYKPGDRGYCGICGNPGKVLAGRGSIEVVPVLTGDDSHSLTPTHITVDSLGAVMLWVWGGMDFDPVLDLTLDPLPVPGRDFGIIIDCVEVAS